MGDLVKSNSTAGMMQSRNLSFDQMVQAAEFMAKSGMFSDITDASQAVVKIMAGQELGIAPFQAVTGVHIIKGKPSMGAGLIASIIDAHPRYGFKTLEHTDRVCEIQFFKDGKPTGKSRFDLNDAQRAGTQNIGKFPKNMLYARAMSNGAKWYCPGAFGGPVYVPEELGGSETDAEMMEAELRFEQEQTSDASLDELQQEARGYLNEKLFSQKELTKSNTFIEEANREELKKALPDLKKKFNDRQKKWKEKFGKKEDTNHHEAFGVEDAQVVQDEEAAEVDL